MSRHVLRYDEAGHKVWSDNQPAAARVQGHGGAAMGFFSGTVLTRKPRRDNPPNPLARQKGRTVT